jgi:hypothetical protein
VVQLARHPSLLQLPTQVVFVSSQLLVHVITVVVVVVVVVIALLPASPLGLSSLDLSSLASHFFTQSSCCVLQVPRQPSSSHLPLHVVWVLSHDFSQEVLLLSLPPTSTEQAANARPRTHAALTRVLGIGSSSSRRRFLGSPCNLDANDRARVRASKSSELRVN